MNLRLASYTPTLLNQYTNRTVPGAVDVMGVSFTTNTVTVNGQGTYRKGEYFRKELAVANTDPVSQSVTVAATGQSSLTGSVLVPRAAEAFWHDLDGNLTSDSLWTNVWNGENRLIAVESAAGVMPVSARMRETWTHLADGRWIERVVSTNNGSAYYPAFTNRFVWDGQVLMAILDHTNGLVMSFVRGLDLSGSVQGAGGVGGVLAVVFKTNGAHFCSYDGNGNVAALCDAGNGTISGQFEYGPFSEPIRVTGTAAHMMPLRFSTMYEDSVTGDRKYLFRDLNPSTGRWKSRDPIGKRGGRNLLALVGNGPPNYSDRLGLEPLPGTAGSPTESDPCQEFEEWYQAEKANSSWLKALPNCPCKIKTSLHCTPGELPTFWKTLDEVSSDKDAEWMLDFDFIVLATRKGAAANCIRSKPKAPGGPARECCYDSSGKLITGGAGAGTVDKGSGDQHIPLDYDPYKLARACDAIRGGNACTLKYLEVRPINNGNHCEKNEPKGWW